MKNLKVSKKLMVSFLMVVILTAAVGGIGITGMSTLSRADEEMYQNNAKPMGDIAVMYDLLSTQRICAANMVIFLESDPQFSREEEVSLGEKEAQFELAMQDYKALLDAGSGKETEREIYASLETMYYSDFALCKQNVKAAVASGDRAAMVSAIKALDSMGSDLSNFLDEANALNNTAAAGKVAANKALSLQRTSLLSAGIGVAVIASVLLALYISGLISKPLTAMSQALDQIGSAGDLVLPDHVATTTQNCETWQDEIGTCARAFGSLIRRLTAVGSALEQTAEGDLTADFLPLSGRDTMGIALKQMIDNLNRMFGEISASSTQVSTGASQVADGAQALASGATQQAASIQELSSAIAEVADTTSRNAQLSRSAAQLAETIKADAEKGSGQMDEMIAAVREISRSSQDISKVIMAIDDIAFQTNILALNAAVEAARAGQHGKGFAVVAEEVRNLAAKSAEAAKDTESLIANSTEKAELGVRIAGETFASLAQIVTGINQSSTLVLEIADSSEKQSYAISQINTGIDQVAQVVQQNSATAEESAAASEEMSSQATTLQRLIAQFRLKDGGLRAGAVSRLEAPEHTGFALSDCRTEW